MTDKQLYSRLYWEGGLPDGSGYKDIGYQQFPAQLIVVDKLLERKPASVLDIGCARGYVVKMLQQHGIPAAGVDISDYCHATRVTDPVHICDIETEMLPFADKEIDLGFSISVLEHIETSKIPHVIREIARVCKRAVLCPSFHDVGTPDKTHRTLQPKEWWERMFAVHAPGFPVEIIDKEEFEKVEPTTLKFKSPARVGNLLVAGRYVDEDMATIQGRNNRSTVLNIGSWIVQFRSTEKDCVINTDIYPDLGGFAQQWGSNYMVYKAPDGLPFPDNSIDAINCSHMLEHLTREEGLKFLKECNRVLKPDGIIRIAVPNAERLVSEYLFDVSDNPLDDIPHVSAGLDRHKLYNIGAEKAEDAADALYHLLLDNHKTIYDSSALGNQLRNAGFTPIIKDFNQTASVPLFRATYDMYPEISLYCEGQKVAATLTLGEPSTGKTTLKESADELAGLGETIGVKAVPPAISALAERIDNETRSIPINAVKDYLAGRISEGRAGV